MIQAWWKKKKEKKKNKNNNNKKKGNWKKSNNLVESIRNNDKNCKKMRESEKNFKINIKIDFVKFQ